MIIHSRMVRSNTAIQLFGALMVFVVLYLMIAVRDVVIIDARCDTGVGPRNLFRIKARDQVKAFEIAEIFLFAETAGAAFAKALRAFHAYRVPFIDRLRVAIFNLAVVAAPFAIIGFNIGVFVAVKPIIGTAANGK